MTTDTIERELPRWDMESVYPGVTSPEFAQAFQSALDAIAELGALFDAKRIELRAVGPLDAATTQTFEEVLARYAQVLEQTRTLRAYLGCLVTADSRDEAAQARLSEFQIQATRLQLLSTRFIAWAGSLDIEALIAASPVAQDHAYPLRKIKTQAAHLMSPAEEALAVELDLTGSTAWDKLYEDFTSQMSVPITINGENLNLPMSRVRNLAFDPDRATRKAAFEAEQAAWERAALPIAAALNSIKGETLTLTRRRGWDSPLDSALFNSNIDRQTLDAMLHAARESFPDFRRYLNAKARILGIPRLAFYDLFAPVGDADGKTWPYEEAVSFVTTNFGDYSPRLRDFAARAFRENWIDAPPRPGKVGGAFCMGLRKDESRILTNYNFAFGGVTTLAHELGHAYHNLNLAARSPLQRTTPMTLAETASIFCETIISQAALKQADKAEQVAILEESLQGSCQVVVDITSRFLFEQSVFEARRQRELSVEEFKAKMLDAQKQTYGDGLDPDTLHPYMWAAKPHYYGRAYYNYPYMFGLLFGLGLYARYQQEPEAFKAGYDDLLASTGLADAATLADRFGIDIRTVDFWRASLDVIRGQVDEFERLIRTV